MKQLCQGKVDITWSEHPAVCLLGVPHWAVAGGIQSVERNITSDADLWDSSSPEISQTLHKADGSCRGKAQAILSSSLEPQEKPYIYLCIIASLTFDLSLQCQDLSNLIQRCNFWGLFSVVVSKFGVANAQCQCSSISLQRSGEKAWNAKMLRRYNSAHWKLSRDSFCQVQLRSSLTDVSRQAHAPDDAAPASLIMVEDLLGKSFLKELLSQFLQKLRESMQPASPQLQARKQSSRGLSSQLNLLRFVKQGCSDHHDRA